MDACACNKLDMHASYMMLQLQQLQCAWEQRAGIQCEPLVRGAAAQ